VLPRTPVVNTAEAKLCSALVAMVGSSRLSVTPTQVLEYLSTHFQVATGEVRVRRSWPDDFLVLFNDVSVADRVLHAQPPPPAGSLSLVFRRLRR
jgi:hypothetical protein